MHFNTHTMAVKVASFDRENLLGDFDRVSIVTSPFAAYNANVVVELVLCDKAVQDHLFIWFKPFELQP